MTPLLLRQLWFLIETTQTQILLTLDDASLVQWLMQQLKTEQPLSHDEANLLSHYIQTKMPLIRDLADNCQSCWQHNS